MAKVEARLSLGIVNFGESVQLTISGSSDGSPDLSGLQKDFDIVNRSKNSSVQLINGSFSRSHSWIFELQPKRIGKLAIPAISVGNEKTQPLEVLVNEPSKTNQDFVLLSEVDTSTQYVGGQIVYSLKLLYRAWLNGQFQLPKMDSFKQITLGENKRYNTVYNNQHYQVVEWRYALIPTKSGSFEIGASAFNGKSRKSGLRLNSKPIAIEVSPQPADWPKTVPWLAARSVKLWDEWEPRTSNWIVGESISRTIYLEVEGVMPEQLNNIDWPLPKNLKIYPENAQRKANNTQNSLRSDLTQKWVIIPEKPQTFNVNELEIVWWDIVNSTRVTTKLKSRQITVEASASPLLSNEPAAIINDVVIAGSTVNVTTNDNTVSASDSYHPVMWFAMGAGWFGWLMAAFLWMRRERRVVKSSEETNSLDEDALCKEIKLAVQNNNGPKSYHLSLRWLKKNKAIIDPLKYTAFEKCLTGLSAQLIAGESPSLDELLSLVESISSQKMTPKKASKIPELYR